MKDVQAETYSKKERERETLLGRQRHADGGDNKQEVAEGEIGIETKLDM